MSILKQAVGIDVAKDKFDVCFAVIDQKQKTTIKSTRKFANSAKGFDAFFSWINKHHNTSLELVFVMEATGVYYQQLAWFLYGQQFAVSVVLPNKAKRYAQSLGIKSKNDKTDAKGLAFMAAQQRLELWQPLSEQFYELRTLTRELEQINHHKTQLNNQLHALRHCRTESKSTIKRIQQTITLLNKQIKQIEQEVEKTVAKDATLKAKVEKITAIKGLGLMSVVTVLAETDGFALFTNQRQLTSYAGYDVVENQSGKHTGKTRISKKGNSHIRRILFMPAFNVVRYKQAPFSNLYERLTGKGKLKMQAYVAVQKKLLLMIYTLWKNGQEYNPLQTKAEINPEIRSLSPSFRLAPQGTKK